MKVVVPKNLSIYNKIDNINSLVEETIIAQEEFNISPNRTNFANITVKDLIIPSPSSLNNETQADNICLEDMHNEMVRIYQL